MVIRLSVLVLLITPSVFPAEPIPLRAGPLSMVFEPDNALLRHVKVGRHKVLQGINAPVRDQFWGTVPPEVRNVRLDEKSDSFTLAFDVSCRQGEIDFLWKGEIRGRADGRLVFTFSGEARSTFLRNRIGFCVLHGPEAAGQPCVVETTDGRKIRGRFPDLISPHQPFKNIRVISHELGGGATAHVRMEGDTFEMEDQRNWTDASFKTYCTPLELPYPVRVEKGTKISHRIELSVDGVDKLKTDAAPTGDVVLRVSDDGSKGAALPGLGLRMSSQVKSLSDAEKNRLRRLGLDHLRVDVSPAEESAIAILDRATRDARSLGVRLHVGLHLGEDAREELKHLAAGLSAIRPPVAIWLVISAGTDRLRLVRDVLKPYGGLIAAGEDANFTELNRARPDPAAIDAVSYGLNPQVHAFDNTSMMETLATQADTVRTARAFVGDLPLVISPITLRPQRADQAPPAGRLPSSVDARQPTPVAAAWTLGSIKYLAEAGVQGFTYFETVGWLGIMEAESGSPLSERFPSRPGAVFPVYHVLRDAGELAGARVLACSSSDPMSVIGLALEKEGRRHLLVANLTPRPRTVTALGIASGARVRRLNSGNLEFAGDSPEEFRRQLEELSTGGDGGLVLKLAPYEVARLDRR